MSPSWNVIEPRNDNEYFERMTKIIFNAGLNWKVVDQKWPNFQKAFYRFSAIKVSKLTSKDVKGLMKNTGIVRNERKIRATIMNASEFMKVQKDYGSFRKYLSSFGEKENDLQKDLQDKFQHMGPSTARMFLWTVNYPLTPNAEEKKWMKAHRDT